MAGKYAKPPNKPRRNRLGVIHHSPAGSRTAVRYRRFFIWRPLPQKRAGGFTRCINNQRLAKAVGQL